MGKCPSFWWTAMVGLVGITTIAAVPAPQNAPSPSSPTLASNSTACGQAAAAVAALDPKANPTPTVAASLAAECLASVPNKPEPAVKLITSLKSFVQWQSTLAFLKDPPPSYGLPAVDVLGELDRISATAAAGKYASEFDFQLDIVKTISKAHDGHFAYRPDVFKVFGFRNKMLADLVSISVDGKQIPKLYHYGDLTGPNGTVTPGNNTMPPAIVKINGQDAATLIEQTNSEFALMQDGDSQWNGGFSSYANPGALTFVAASLVFRGPSTTITYDNGRERTEDNYAIIRRNVNLTGVKNGEEYYNKFCNPNAAPAAAAPAPGPSTPPPAPAPPAPVIEGFPFPFVRDNGFNVTSGYHLNGTGYDDVAVLSITAFSPANPSANALPYLVDFQRTIRTFLAKSKEANKKRLVIDLSANGGGLVLTAYELYTQLFPTASKFQANNLRESEALTAIARIAGARLNDIIDFNGTSKLGNTTAGQREASAFNTLRNSALVGALTPGGVFSPSGVNLTTTDMILAPVSLKGDTFTAYQQEPLNQTDPDFNLTGVGTNANPPPAVFDPANVVLLTDGTCGSTCTIFSYLMIFGQNVKTTVVGGRPTTGPMQAIAGVEGAEVFFLTELSAVATAAANLSPDANKTGSQLQLMDEGYALLRATDPNNAGAVNGKNAFSPADSMTPLQFLYQPANCRFFYTKDMIQGPTEVWKRAVDATWTDPAKFCVEGSMVPLNATTKMVDGRFFTRDMAKALALGEPVSQAMSASGASVTSRVASALWVLVSLAMISLAII